MARREAAHPSVIAMRARARDGRPAAPPRMLDADWLRRLCLDAGADDVGFVEIELAELAEERAELDKAFPGTQALISIVCRMNREPARSPARSVANLEFHATNRRTDEVARRAERSLLAAVLLGRIRLRGSPRLLAAFGRCFPR